jgi:phosphate starvation-inducible protein PhoH
MYSNLQKIPWGMEQWTYRLVQFVTSLDFNEQRVIASLKLQTDLPAQTQKELVSAEDVLTLRVAE